MYTLQLDTEGKRGQMAHEVAYVIREKDTNNCVTFGEWYCGIGSTFIEFMVELGKQIEKYDIRHINTWGKTDFDSICHTFEFDKMIYSKAGLPTPYDDPDCPAIVYARETYTHLDYLYANRWHDSTVYIQHILYTDDDLLNAYHDFGWDVPSSAKTSSSGMLKLQNLARFVYNDHSYKQTHHALEDCYDAQSVHLFFAQHDLANSIRWNGSYKMNRA